MDRWFSTGKEIRAIRGDILVVDRRMALASTSGRRTVSNLLLQIKTEHKIQRARKHYMRDGFYLADEPVVSATMLEEAVAGMVAVRDEEYDTGVSPTDSTSRRSA